MQRHHGSLEACGKIFGAPIELRRDNRSRGEAKNPSCVNLNDPHCACASPPSVLSSPCLFELSHTLITAECRIINARRNPWQSEQEPASKPVAKPSHTSCKFLSSTGSNPSMERIDIRWWGPQQQPQRQAGLGNTCCALQRPHGTQPPKQQQLRAPADSAEGRGCGQLAFLRLLQVFTAPHHAGHLHQHHVGVLVSHGETSLCS